MPLQAENEASHVCESLQSLLIACGRNGMSDWYLANASGALQMEVQRGQAALAKVSQLLLESDQWSGADENFVARVQALKERLETLIAASA